MQKLTAQQEKFAQAIALEDMSQADAYRSAYNTSKMTDEVIWVKASELAKNAADKANIEAAVNDLKEKNKGNDVEAIKAATEAVQKAFYAVSEKLYQQQPQQGAPTGNPNDPIDADFEEVND